MHLKELHVYGMIISIVLISCQDLQKDTKKGGRNFAKFHTTQVSGFKSF